MKLSPAFISYLLRWWLLSVEQPQAKTSTWRTMHYYKLQHAFFTNYHSSHPVYASWGPQRNPDILKEPGVSCSPGVMGREFAARGAEKRARHRRGAIESERVAAVSEFSASTAVREFHLPA